MKQLLKLNYCRKAKHILRNKKERPMWLKLSEIMAFCNYSGIVEFRSDAGALKIGERFKIIDYFAKHGYHNLNWLLLLKRHHLKKCEVDEIYDKLLEVQN